MSLDLSDDYLTCDLEEPVTLVSRATTPHSHDESLDITHSFWGPLTYKELAATSGAAVRMQSAVDIPQKLLRDYTFKPGDQLVNEAGETFNIYLTNRDAGTAFSRFLVYNPKIAYDLRHVIDVFNLELGKDAAGAATVDAESLVYQDIACRVQWTSGQPSTVNKRTGETHQAVIYLSQRLYLKNNYLIRWADDTQNKVWEFDVIEWSMTERLDELMQVRVKAVP